MKEQNLYISVLAIARGNDSFPPSIIGAAYTENPCQKEDAKPQGIIRIRCWNMDIDQVSSNMPPGTIISGNFINSAENDVLQAIASKNEKYAKIIPRDFSDIKIWDNGNISISVEPDVEYGYMGDIFTQNIPLTTICPVSKIKIEKRTFLIANGP